MGYANPTNHQPPQTQRTALKQLQALSLQVLRRTQGFLAAQKLPYIANKACEAYLGEANRGHQASCRRILRTCLEINPTQLHHFFHTPLGNDLLRWFEQFFHVPGDRTQETSLKDLLLQMATDPEGLSLLSFLRRSPHTIQFNSDQLMLTAKRVEWLLQATEEAIAVIRELATEELKASPAINFSNFLDIRQPGAFQVKRYRLVLEKTQRDWLTNPAPLEVCCYQPQPFPAGDIPVVIQSHGLASSPEDLAVYAEHLASYGYFVAAPQHAGSDHAQIRNMLSGQSPEVFQLQEFIDRPQDIRDLLDELERRNLTDFEGKLNLKAVGVMGCSFGAYTALMLAGAEIQFQTLESACDITVQNPNLSLLLQCQALKLPRQAYHLADNRIQAILAVDAIGSEVFGLQGIENIQRPVLLIAGTQDIAAPLIFEQIRMFQWLTSPHRFLALMQGKSHIQDMQRLMNSLELQIKTSPQMPLAAKVTPFEQYTQALSLAFFNQYLERRMAAIPPLGAGYAAGISCAPFELWLISQASSEVLKQRLLLCQGNIDGSKTPAI